MISIIAFLTVIVGCSNEGEIQAISIIDKWTLVSRTINEIQVPIDECEKLFEMAINSNRTLFTQFNATDIPEKCQIINFLALDWKKISKNLY